MARYTQSQKFAAEMIGTAILVFIGAGSVPIASLLLGGDAGGPAALAAIALAFAFAIMAAVYAVGHISGCHINPAITLGLLATGRIDGATAASYIVAQFVGAFVGAAGTLLMLSGNDPQALGLGAASVNANAGVWIGTAAEIIGAAILVFVVFGSAVSGRAPGGFAGIAIGFTLAGIILAVGPISGASLNPARELGPALLGQAIGAAAVPVDHLLIAYVVGPIIGGLIGAFAYEWLGREQPEATAA